MAILANHLHIKDATSGCVASAARRWGLLGGLANAALTTYITRGKEPWTLKHRCSLMVLLLVPPSESTSCTVL